MSAFRLGNRAPSGRGKPFTPHTKTYNCVTSARIKDGLQANQMGFSNVYDLTAWNMPLLGINGENLIQIGQQRHPTGHRAAEIDLFVEAEIKSSMYRFTIWFVGTAQTAREDFVFAYKFANQGSNADYSFTTAGGAGTIQWLDMRQSRGWIWKRMSATNAGGSIWPSAAIVEVKVPHMGNLVYGLNEGVKKVTGSSPLSVIINDGVANTVSELQGFLHVMCFNLNDIAWDTATNVLIDVDHFAHVKLTRTQISTEMLEEAEVGEA